MTQQYLTGELSLLLGQLQATMEGEATASQLARLRHGIETGPSRPLSSTVMAALAACDRACWEALTLGDTRAFTCRTAICAELLEFGVCAGLLNDELAAWGPAGGTFAG